MESLYQTFVSIRNTELNAYWSRYNIQVVLNFGLLAATLSAKLNSFIAQHRILVGVGGIILSLVWIGFILMSKKLLTKRWEFYIRELEKNFSDDKLRLFTYIKEAENELRKTKLGKLKNCWRNLNILAYIPPFLCISAWVFYIIN